MVILMVKSPVWCGNKNAQRPKKYALTGSTFFSRVSVVSTEKSTISWLAMRSSWCAPPARGRKSSSFAPKVNIPSCGKSNRLARNSKCLEGIVAIIITDLLGLPSGGSSGILLSVTTLMTQPLASLLQCSARGEVKGEHTNGSYCRY